MGLLSMQNISKVFPGVKALDQVSLTVEKGEIHALLGENGAGKTTLMNILYGLYRADGGQIFWKENPIEITRPEDAITAGIGMVHQHFMLVRKMTALDNILLGLRLPGYPIVHKEDEEAKVKSLCAKYGLEVDLNRRVDQLSVGEQQRVEILKALYRNAELLILDEPTSVLTTQEVQEFFNILRTLAKEGHSIILIAHNLSEVMSVCNRISVLRNGKNICTVSASETNEVELSRYMIGRNSMAEKQIRAHTDQSHIAIELHDITLRQGNRKVLDHINLTVRKGEVLGIAGVDGNGQSELAEVITGIRTQSEGDIILNDEPVHGNIRNRWEQGISYVPSDRHRDGLIMDASVAENAVVRSYYRKPYSSYGVLHFPVIRKTTERLTEEYEIKTPGPDTKIRLLSGGNQQKLLLARELMSNGEVIVACQPTRGLDIGATEFVRNQLMVRRNQGCSILLFSTDLEEILSLSDRIAVMHGGEVMGIVENTSSLSNEVIGLMMGGRKLSEVAI